MGNDSRIDMFLDLFWTLKLKNRLTYLSLCVKYPQEDTHQFLKSLRELASEVNFDQKRFNDLLDDYLNTANKNDLNRLDAFVNSHYDNIENEVLIIPNDINKAYDSLRGLIGSKYFMDHLQAYDAMVLLKDEISSDLIKEIIVEWKLDEQSHDSDNLGNFSSIFWVSYDFMEFIDSISMYRFIETFDIKGFDSTFKEVKKDLESVLWEYLPPETLDSGPFYFWLIDRVPGFVDEYYGTTTFLESIVNEQSEQGYWNNRGLIKSQLVDEDTGIIKWTEYGKDTSGTALCSINLIKHSKCGSLRDSGIKGVKWLLEQQNSDGSWSDEIKSRPTGKIENKKSLFATLLALEALIRSEIPNLTTQIELAFEWIMSKQNKWGYWDDDKFLPLFAYSSFPLMTVLVLELENLIQFYKKKQLVSLNNEMFSKSKGDLMKMGNYEILEQIGDGGFSKVHKCVNSDGQFAIKVPQIIDSLDESRFKREIRMNQSLDHENTMPICDINLEETPFFFTMPLGDMNLDSYIKEHKLRFNTDKKIITEIIQGIALGLKHAHDNNVIHRDLKPQNVIIFENDGDITPKICDFGAGRFSLRDTTILTRTGESIYSLDFCAPEQREEFRDVDQRADIYSYGKIVYWIVTGNNPLNYDLSDIPPEYVYIISNACQRNPDDRYQDVSELIEDLDMLPILFENDPSKLIKDEIKKIEKSGDYSKNNIKYLAKVLSINQDNEVLDDLPNLPDEILRSLLTHYEDLFYLSIKSLDEKVRNSYMVPNGQIDIIAEFFKKIEDIGASTQMKSLMIKTLAYLGVLESRYSAVGTFTYIIENNMQDSALMKETKKILRDSDEKSFLEQNFKPETRRKLDRI